MKRNALKRIAHRAFASLLLATSYVAWAALVTIPGTDFDVVYDNTSLGLFGAPSLSGDTIFFTPVTFAATSSNGAGTQLTNSTINLRLVAKPGFSFGQIQLLERGDYTLNGAGSSVNAGGQLSAFDINDPINAFGSQFITVSGATPLTINDALFHPWRAGANLDVSSDPFSQPRELNVTLENVLTATTQPNVSPSLAFIEKKFAGAPISLQVLAVPLPAALWLFGSGLLVLVPLLRRVRAMNPI